MPLYTYKAMREDGTAVTDEAMAADIAQLRQDLEASGYLVASCKKKIGLGAAGAAQRIFSSSTRSLPRSSKQGLPILQSLEILQKRMEKPGFRAALESIIHDIKGGAALSDAMARHPAYFSPLYTATVRQAKRAAPSSTCSCVSSLTRKR